MRHGTLCCPQHLANWTAVVEDTNSALKQGSMCAFIQPLRTWEATLCDLLRTRLEAGCDHELSPFGAMRPSVRMDMKYSDMGSFVTKGFEKVLPGST